MLVASNVRPMATSTLGVNAAFLQEIKDSNPDLTHIVHEVRTTCQTEMPAAAVAKRLVRLLDDLRDCLAFQFALEESYGYIENARSVSESVSDLAKRARGEHCTLYLEISSLCELAEELQYRGFAAEHVDELIRDTESFDAALIQHERLEAELVARAYRTLQI